VLEVETGRLVGEGPGIGLRVRCWKSTYLVEQGEAREEYSLYLVGSGRMLTLIFQIEDVLDEVLDLDRMGDHC
jgi:hypothetical protein